MKKSNLLSAGFVKNILALSVPLIDMFKWFTKTRRITNVICANIQLSIMAI
jgi:hypothetical protein